MAALKVKVCFFAKINSKLTFHKLLELCVLKYQRLFHICEANKNPPQSGKRDLGLKDI